MFLPPIVRRYAASGWRHRWKALVLAWLVCIPGWIAVSMMPNQYQANARIYADPEALLGTLLKGLAADSSPARQVEMLQRTLLSRPNLERVIARTDLDMRVRDTASRERLIEALGRDIRITLQTRQLFRIDYTDTDPRLAYEVVRTMIALFMEAATSNDRQQMQSAQAFLQHQIMSYEAQLREAEQRRAEFRARYVDILPSDLLGGGTRLEQARGKLADLRGTLTDAQTRRDLLRKQLEETPASFAGPASGGGRLAEAERQLRELQLRYTDRHPDVIAQRAIIAGLRASGAGTGAPPRPGTGVPNPLHEQVRLRLVDADTEVASLERQVAAMEADVQRLDNLARAAPHVQAEFQNMDRDYAVLRKNYEELLARRESLQIAGAARTDGNPVRLDVVDPPTVPVDPIGPKRTLFALGVLAAGLGAGTALMLLMVALDTGFYTIHDLRTIGLPVLGGISSATPPPRRLLAGLAFGAAVLILLGAFGAFQAVGPKLVARLPGLLTRLLA